MKAILTENPEEIEQVIASCEYCFLGLASTEGEPYVVPMNFGFRDGIIYLHSAPDGNLVEMATRNNRICVSFCAQMMVTHQHPDVACSYSMDSKSVVAFGQVEFVEDLGEKERMLNILMEKYAPGKRFSYSEPALRNVKVWKIEPEKITCKCKERYKRH